MTQMIWALLLSVTLALAWGYALGESAAKAECKAPSAKPAQTRRILT